MERNRKSLILAVLLILFILLDGDAYAAKFKGIEYEGLKQFAREKQLKSSWSESKENLTLSSSSVVLEFKENSRICYLNGLTLFLGDPVKRKGRRMYVSRQDMDKTLGPILYPQDHAFPEIIRRIVIDPGHGGLDSGSQNEFLQLQEKHLALDISLRLKEQLEASGYEVVLLRHDDTYIELPDRSAYANNIKADLFISIHLNAAHNLEAEGVETFAFTPFMQPSTGRTELQDADKFEYPGNRNDAANTLLAYYVQKDLVNQLNATDRGLKRARFLVLKDLKIPGILIEAGFLSNSEEAVKLGTKSYRQRVAESVALSIERFQRTLRRLHSQR